MKKSGPRCGQFCNNLRNPDVNHPLDDTSEDAYLAQLQTIYEHSTQAALIFDQQLEDLLKRLRQFKFHCPPLLIRFFDPWKKQQHT